MGCIKWTNERIYKKINEILPSYKIIKINREKYKSPRIFLECGQDHKYDAYLNNVLKGQKCAQCTGNVKFTLIEIPYWEFEYIEEFLLDIINKNNC